MYIRKQACLILLLFVGITLLQSKCTDRPQCFKKKIFNFNFPEMNVYPIIATTDVTNNFSMKAYGDFNSDLYTDFIAVTQKGQIVVFVWNSDILLFQKVFTQPILNQCYPKTIYLYDTSDDGRLDFVLWGVKLISGKQTNCLMSFVRNATTESHIFIFNNTAIKQGIQLTTDPILFTHKFEGNIDSVGFLIFMNDGGDNKTKTRTFIKYRNIAQPIQYFFRNKINSQTITWKTLMKSQQNYESVGFRDPHWNTFLDLTGDCQPDLIVLNQNNQAEVWINYGKTFYLYKPFAIATDIKGFTISDINYDGSGDLIVAEQKQIKIYLNQQSLQPDSQFCNPQSKSFTFNQNFISLPIPETKSIKKQTLHFGDINIDGYPDLLLILIDQINNKQNPYIYQNNFQTDQSFSLFTNPNYNTALASLYQKNQIDSIQSVSFIDILENGILDIIVCSNFAGKVSTQVFYNNFLLQNDYYIKGFGLEGPDCQTGSQFPAMSFYWVNSVKNGFKVTYQSQMIQTSYDALQMPYTFSGLGRANNYVQSFTVGRNGKKQVWSPIIPNSQLGVFTTNGQAQDWQIRIFSFPLYELLDVLYVTIVILSIFGIYLAFKKCKMYRNKQAPSQVPF